MNLQDALDKIFGTQKEIKEKLDAAPSADELVKLRNDLAASNAEITNLKKQIEASATDYKKLDAALTAKDSEIANLKSELEKAQNKANEVIAGQGINPDQLPAQTPAASGSGTPGVVEQLMAIQDPKERTAFYRKHEAAIKAARK